MARTATARPVLAQRVEVNSTPTSAAIMSELIGDTKIQKIFDAR
jgi:hypothetical protein